MLTFRIPTQSNATFSLFYSYKYLVIRLFVSAIVCVLNFGLLSRTTIKNQCANIQIKWILSSRTNDPNTMNRFELKRFSFTNNPIRIFVARKSDTHTYANNPQIHMEKKCANFDLELHLNRTQPQFFDNAFCYLPHLNDLSHAYLNGMKCGSGAGNGNHLIILMVRHYQQNSMFSPFFYFCITLQIIKKAAFNVL